MYINNGLIAFSHDLMHWESEETGYDLPGGEGCFALSRGEDIIPFTGGNHWGISTRWARCSSPVRTRKSR